MSTLSKSSFGKDDLHLVWDSLLFLIGEADIFHASVLERLHIIETTLKGDGGDAVVLGNFINRRAETSGLAKGLLLLNQVITNTDKRYLLSELQEAQNGILKRLQDLRRTFSIQEEKITAPNLSECNELVNLTNLVREAINDHYDILRSAVYTLVAGPMGQDLGPESSKEVKYYYEELLNLKNKRNYRHEATNLLYEDWINYIDKKIDHSNTDEIKEIDLTEMGNRYAATSEGNNEESTHFDSGIPVSGSQTQGDESTELEFGEDHLLIAEDTEMDHDSIKNLNPADDYLVGQPVTARTVREEISEGDAGFLETVRELSGKVVMLDKDLSKTLSEINNRLDMITFGAKEKRVTTVYRNESEILSKLESAEKRTEDRLKKMENQIEVYTAENDFRMKRSNRQFDKQISDVIKSEIGISDKLNKLEEQINAGILDTDQVRAIQTSERKMSLVENQLNQLEKNFTIFRNLLEAKYNQRLEQTEQKYMMLKESLHEDILQLKEQVTDTVKRAETKNYEIENQISKKLDEIRSLIYDNR